MEGLNVYPGGSVEVPPIENSSGVRTLFFKIAGLSEKYILKEEGFAFLDFTLLVGFHLFNYICI